MIKYIKSLNWTGFIIVFILCILASFVNENMQKIEQRVFLILLSLFFSLF